MSLLSNNVASTDKSALPLDLPLAPEPGAARRDAAQSAREDNWENEGGQVATARPAITSPAVSAGNVEALEAEVHRMEIALANDLANGRVGLRYNVYAHRARVVSQLKAKMHVLRASFPEQRQGA